MNQTSPAPLKKEIANRIKVKRAIAAKCRHLASIAGSKIKRGSYLRKAKVYDAQATVLEKAHS